MFYAQDVTEHVNVLNIYNSTPQVIYSVPIERIEKENVLQITSELEATNPYSYNVMIGCKIILGKTEQATEGVLIDSANAFNITPNMHHGVVTKIRNWKAQSTYINPCINLVCWSASVNSHPNDTLKIEKNYGHLDLYIHKNTSEEFKTELPAMVWPDA